MCESVEKSSEKASVMCEVLTLCAPFLHHRDIVNLRCTNKCLSSWSYRTDVFLQMISSHTFTRFSVIKYWESCLTSQNLSIDYSTTYDHLRGYGFGKQFIENEGIYGDISRDVNRTFPTHILFKTAGGLGQVMLENVLRCLSEYFSNIGYCQGMNFVVGVIIIAIADPTGLGFLGNEEKDQQVLENTVIESQLSIEKRTFAIVVNMIRLMHMEELWSSGIPGLRRFVYILQKYMAQYCPKLLTYFEEIGYDVSIIVSKWFITLFAYVTTLPCYKKQTLPFPLLFRLWGFILREHWSGVMIITISLLQYFEPHILSKDIVQFSIMMKDVRTQWLQTQEEQSRLFDIMKHLKNVNEATFVEFEQQYQRELNNRGDLDLNYTPVIDKQEILRRRKQITLGIDTIRAKLEEISEQEYAIKMEFQKYQGILTLLEEEIDELKEHKQSLLNQVESLLYLDQHLLFDDGVTQDEMARISFQRQQDVRVICQKMKGVSELIKKKMEVQDAARERFEEVKKKWEGILAEKDVLKEELMDAVKEQTSLMNLSCLFKMQFPEHQVTEYFFGKTVKPGETSTVALMFRELALTNVAYRSSTSTPVRVKGILDGQEFTIANLSPKHPQCRLDMKFTKDCMLVSFEVEGDAEVDLIGYVTGLDTKRMMSLKEAMELSEASDDEDYMEEEEEESEQDKKNDDEEEEEGKEENEENEEEEEEEEENEEEEGEEEEQVKYEPMEEVPRDKVNFSASGYKHLGKFIKYKDIVSGSGNLPINGHVVEISYKMTLPTGEVLDSENIDHSTRIPFPTQFRVGLGHVVKGMDRAILGMRVGGVREILLAPEMGFDDRGNLVSDIRPGESFIVEVHLLGARYYVC